MSARQDTYRATDGAHLGGTTTVRAPSVLDDVSPYDVPLQPVDGGGDIRAGGHNDGEPWTIAVGDGLTASLRTRLHDRAVATSSTLQRRWRTAAGEAHHIIAPASGSPATGTVVTATVIAPDATTADALATALIADRDRALCALEALAAEALLLGRDGAWTMTAGMARYLA